MLERLPLVGEFVEVLKDGVWDDTNQRYQTKGDIHQIVGISPLSGVAYFIGDTGTEIYIDEAAFKEYRLADKEVELPEDKPYYSELLDILVEIIDERIEKKIKEVGSKEVIVNNVTIHESKNANADKIIADLSRELSKEGSFNTRAFSNPKHLK